MAPRGGELWKLPRQGHGRAPAQLAALVKTVGNVTVENVTQMQVDLHAALFDDGTRLEAGTFYKRNPDPNDSRKWIRIERLFK